MTIILDDAAHDLGACCTCGTTLGVVNVVMLSYRGPTPGKGWGCVVCGLPADGAVAVLCDACMESGMPIKFICTGYPGKDGRTPTDDIGVLAPFDHDMTKHRLGGTFILPEPNQGIAGKKS